MAMSDYILNKVIDDPHLAIHIQSYPDRLFENINVIIDLLIFNASSITAACQISMLQFGYSFISLNAHS